MSSVCTVAAAKRPPHGKADCRTFDPPHDTVPSKKRPVSAGPFHRWDGPLMLHLAIDSIAATWKTRSDRWVVYTKKIIPELLADNNIMLSVSRRLGGDLPELADAIKTNTAAHAHMLISMSNYAVESIDKDGVSENMFAACDALCEVKQQVKVIYGGAGELWRSVGNKLDKFEDKTMRIRNYLQERGMDVESGAEDLRSRFTAGNIDDRGQFLGRCCGDQPRVWIKSLLLGFSYKLYQEINTAFPKDSAPVSRASHTVNIFSIGLTTLGIRHIGQVTMESLSKAWMSSRVPRT